MLAIGVCAGVFANTDVMKSFSEGWPVIETSLGIAVALITAVVIAKVRKSLVGQTHIPGWKVMVCLAMSGAAIGFPSYVSFTY